MGCGSSLLRTMYIKSDRGYNTGPYIRNETPFRLEPNEVGLSLRKLDENVMKQTFTISFAGIWQTCAQI